LASVAAALPLHTAEAQRRRNRQREPEMIIEECIDIRVLDATQYWFWSGYFGVTEITDLGNERIGRVVVDPNICFRVLRTGLDDPSAKTRGYRLAVEELLKWVTDEPPPEGEDSNSSMARERLTEITGQRFREAEAWVSWWNTNRDFLWWSQSEERLLVDVEARRAGTPLLDDVVVLSAEEYWFYEARGWMSSAQVAGEYVRGAVLMPPQLYNFRIRAEELEDTEAKRAGYTRAVQNLIFDGLLSPELQGTDQASVNALLFNLTGQRFDNRNAWIRWWDRNHLSLQLTPGGERLAVQQR
jgi:hypothetical protein